MEMCCMILTKEDAIYASKYFQEYFDGFGRIDDYLRRVKLERINNMPTMLPMFSYGDEMFSDFTVHPNDMNFRLKVVEGSENKKFNDLLEVTTSHAIEDSVPGKTIKILVYETNTNKLVGFIRLGSPVLNLKPRNDFLGKSLDTRSQEIMKLFNKSAIMGFVIVPTQPFGFNYLGGKLLAAICCSHDVKKLIDDKYDTNICHFETTSLYGTSKSASQYDGMKPYLRNKGLTDSNFTPMLNDEKFRDLNTWFTKKIGGDLVEKGVSSRKLKIQSAMISIIKSSLKKISEKDYIEFCETIENAKSLTERKRVYISDYGFANTKEYLNMETETLIKKDNFDSYSFENVVQWWKKKSSSRFEKLKESNELRFKQEIWSENSDIDIIR